MRRMIANIGCKFMSEIISIEAVANKICAIRDEKVMLDRDLAELYGVETGQLKRAIRRNIDRFPDEFMLVLDEDEFKILRCQIGTSSWGGVRYSPMAFTEQGVAMLSSVLKSKQAIHVNIQIMTTLTHLRQIVLENTDLKYEFEKHKEATEDRFQIVIEALDQILPAKGKSKKKIGFIIVGIDKKTVIQR